MRIMLIAIFLFISAPLPINGQGLRNDFKTVPKRQGVIGHRCGHNTGSGIMNPEIIDLRNAPSGNQVNADFELTPRSYPLKDADFTNSPRCYRFGSKLELKQEALELRKQDELEQRQLASTLTVRNGHGEVRKLPAGFPLHYLTVGNAERLWGKSSFDSQSNMHGFFPKTDHGPPLSIQAVFNNGLLTTYRVTFSSVDSPDWVKVRDEVTTKSVSSPSTDYSANEPLKKPNQKL